MDTYPQVLLLGNGINLCNGGESWKNFLLSIKDKNFNLDIENLKSPMPLQAILVSQNKLQDKLNTKSQNLLPNRKLKDEILPISSILEIGFDYILTTNYTYEIEQACVDNNSLSKYKLKKSCKTAGGRVDSKYLIRTFNEFCFKDKTQRIWHIHGEARKPSSMVLGHYYYGNLVNKIIDYLNDKETYISYQRHGFNVEIKSFIDAFIMGDVYILGQGFDFSEIDLWWLLNRKLNENANHGDTYFYEPKRIGHDEKYALLDVLGVKVRHLGIKEIIKNDKSIIEYEKFYQQAIEDIRKNVNKKSLHTV